MALKIAYIDEEFEDRETYSQLLESEELSIFPVDPFAELDAFVEYLLEENFDALIVDYTLFATRPDVDYSGVELVRSIWKKRKDFPAFILTNNRDEKSVDNEIPSTKVFIKKQIALDDEDLNEMKHKIKKEIEFYRSENSLYKEELYELVNKKNRGEKLTDLELQRIRALNVIIEERTNIDEGFTDIIKDSENMKKLSNLLDDAESFLNKINRELE